MRWVLAWELRLNGHIRRHRLPATAHWLPCSQQIPDLPPQPLCHLLTDAASSGKYVAAICAAPSVLGGLGLLKGKKATCYPGFEDKLVGASVCSDSAVVDGNIITSRGMGTAIDFSGELIAVLSDRETSDRIKASIMYH